MNGVLYIEDMPFHTNGEKVTEFDIIHPPELKTYLMGNLGNCQDGEFDVYIKEEHKNAIMKWANNTFADRTMAHKASGRFCEYSDKGKLLHEIFLSGIIPDEFPSEDRFHDGIYIGRFSCESFKPNMDAERRATSLCKTVENPLPEYFWQLSYRDDSGKFVYEYYASIDEARERSLEISSECFVSECYMHREDKPLFT